FLLDRIGGIADSYRGLSGFLTPGGRRHREPYELGCVCSGFARGGGSDSVIRVRRRDQCLGGGNDWRSVRFVDGAKWSPSAFVLPGAGIAGVHGAALSC